MELEVPLGLCEGVAQELGEWLADTVLQLL